MTRRRKLLIFLWLLELLLFWAPPRAAAQSQTTVTGNVVDPKGFFYAGGSVKATLFPPGVASPCVFTGPNCVPIPATVGTVPIDFFGNFTINLYPNNLIFCNQGPCTTQWTFQICIQPGVIEPPIGTGDQCFAVTVTISGASQNITAQITAAPPPQLTRIPIGGGGGGCTPSGVDTGILSEHPVGSCFDSLHATWDDGASKQNLQFGDGTNTNTGAQLSFMLGSAVKANACFECWNFGQSNNLTSAGLANDEEKFAFGVFNVNSGAGTSWQIGDTNTMNFAGASHCTGCQDDLVQLGFENNMSSTVATVYEAPSVGHQFGSQNQVTMNVAGGKVTNFLQSGVANAFTESTGSSTGIELAFAYGLQNRVKDDLGTSSVFDGLYGFDNEADSIDPQDVSIFGASNTVHSLVICSVGSCPPAQDSVIVGDQNTVTNAGSVLLASVNSSVTNCLACGAFGYNEANSTSNSLAIGMGNHEIKITPNLVTIPSLASASVSSVCASTTGGLEIAGCPSSGIGTVYTVGTQQATISSSATNFAPFSGSVSTFITSINIFQALQIVSVAATAQNPVALTTSAQPASGSLVLALFDSTTSTATAVTITIPASGAAGVYAGSGTATLVVGHSYAWRAVNSATAASAAVQSISFQYK